MFTVIQGSKSATKNSTNNEITLPPYASPDKNDFPLLKDYRDQALDQAEKLYLESLFYHCNGNINQAASISGLSNSRIYALLKKHQIKKSYLGN
jgi:two-component system NtrC family response regulator